MPLVQRKYPQVDTIIDLATLTGAVIVALGEYAAGLWSNSDPLVQALRTAAAQTHNERVRGQPQRHTQRCVDRCGICQFMKNTPQS